jgi:hypothetical protein
MSNAPNTQTLPVSRAVAPYAQTVPSNIALSGPMRVNISVYRGDSGRFRLAIGDSLGAPIDVSTATWDADIRLQADDPSTITEFDVELVTTVTDNNTIDIILDAAKSALLPATCVYDLEMTLAGEVTTLIYGTITTTYDVSRTP